jgi:NAD(P)-dependent dehydrogenase (short-subunit alcohol dehydrogenase family)
VKTFEGKVAVVTGGSSGIGRATALALARVGARVVIAARGRERGQAVQDELRALGAEAEFVVADVTRTPDVERLFGATMERFGRLDCAVNNAADPEGSLGPLAELTEEQFREGISTNLESVWLCMRAEIRRMLAQGSGGSIVNTSSVNGLGGVPEASVYAAAKAGVIALTKSAALEYATDRIRINAVVPGMFMTPMLQGVFERISPGDPDAAKAQAEAMVPMHRIGTPDEAAQAILWLLSDAASFVTGHALVADGGLTAPYR